jgi:hypothetical protein
LTKQPLFTANALERHSTLAATTVVKSFYPRPPLLSRRPSLEAVGDKGVANESVISKNDSRVAVRVIHTDEEWMISNTVCRILGHTSQMEKGT